MRHVLTSRGRASIVCSDNSDKLTEPLLRKGLHQSLLSIMASAGGIVGPIWLGVSVGVPKVDEHGKTIGPVAQVSTLHRRCALVIHAGFSRRCHSHRDRG